MKTYKQNLFDKLAEENKPRSYVERNANRYIIAKPVIILALCYSAFSSFGWYNTMIQLPFIIRIVISIILSVGVSAIIGFMIKSTLRDFRADGVVSWFSIMLLIPLISFNCYTDYVGVEDNSKTIAQMSPALQKNQKSITQYEQIKSDNANWNDYSPKNGKWTYHATWLDAKENLQRLYAENKELKKDADILEARLSNGLKGGVAVAMALIIGLSMWVNYYGYRCYLEKVKSAEKVEVENTQYTGSQSDSQKVEVFSQSASHFDNIDLAGEVERQLANVDEQDLHIAEVIRTSPKSLNSIAKELGVSRSKVQLINKQFNIR